MSESFGQLFNNKWRNIEYNFNDHSNNCTLNVYVANPVINCDLIIELNLNNFINFRIDLLN